MGMETGLDMELIPTVPGGTQALTKQPQHDNAKGRSSHGGNDTTII